MTCQLSRSTASRRSGERSSLWRISSVRSGATTRKRTSESSVRDPGVAAEERLAEHRGPLHLEQEGRPAADVPDAVDLGDVVDRSADLDEIRPVLALVEPVAQPSRAELAGLLAAADPDVHPEPMAAVGELARSSRRAAASGGAGRRR